MNFTVSSTALSSRLQALGRVITSKNTAEALECFLMEPNGNTMKITASDGETMLVTHIELIENECVGRLAVKAQLMLDSLRELPEQPLTFEVNDDTYEMLITYQNGQYSIVGQNPMEYPILVGPSADATHLSIHAPLVLDGIGRAVFATAADDLRPVMNGVNVVITPEFMDIAASDAHKLVRSRSTSVTADNVISFILPKKAASLFRILMPREEAPMEITSDGRMARFELNGNVLTCRLTEGRYPNYNAVIPAGSPYNMVADRQLLLSALKRVSVVTPSDTSLVKFEIACDRVKVSTEDFDFSKSAVETVPCQYDGGELVIGFKAPFLIDMLSNLTSNEVVFQLTDASRATVVVPGEQSEMEEVMMMIMPMMLNY